jgi:hypothetical protein
MMNRIYVFFNLGDTPIFFDDSSIIVDNADGSVRIECKSETVAHYNADEFHKITQEIT